MTLIKNSIKLLAIMFCVGVVTQNNSFARDFSTSYSMNNILIDSSYNKQNLFNYYTNNFHFTLYTWSNIVSWNLMSYNDWDVFRTTRRQNGPTRTYQYNYNFIKVVRNSNTANSTMNFYVWRDNIKAYRQFDTPNIWRSDTINWESVIFDKWFPWHWSIILFSSSTNHSIQIIWNKTLLDKVVYVDPRAVTDNLRVIDYYKWKAWSITIPYDDTLVLSSYMFWEWGQDNKFFYDFELMADNDWKSYSIQTWGSYWWPQTISQGTYNYYSTADWYHYYQTEDSTIWDTRFYKEDLQYFSPDWWLSYESSTSDYFNSDVINEYNKCVNKWENLRKYLNLMWYCRRQSQDSTMISDILSSQWQYIYTWDLLYCKSLVDFNKQVFNIYSGTWNYSDTFKNVDLYDYDASFNDLVFSWFNNAIIIQENWHVDNLPSWNSWCSSYTISEFNNSNKSWLESVADYITDFFWSDIADDFKSNVWDWNSFSWIVDSFSSWLSWYFNNRFFAPYIEEFNNWRSTFSNVVNVPQCSVIKESVWVYSWWNIALFWFSAVLLLILLTLL